jgi:predicted O-methyltransferase YrrM
MDIQNLFKHAVDHRNEHDCSAYPYENGEKLIQAVKDSNAKAILEIGTGCGYTATIMALVSRDIRIDTIEKDAYHAQMAKEFASNCGVINQIKIITEAAEEYLPTIEKQYDLIFFDGYQIHYEFLPHYDRLLKLGGILFLANNHLQSRTSNKFFENLNNRELWEIKENFADTTVAVKVH